MRGLFSGVPPYCSFVTQSLWQIGKPMWHAGSFLTFCFCLFASGPTGTDACIDLESRLITVVWMNDAGYTFDHQTSYETNHPHPPGITPYYCFLCGANAPDIFLPCCVLTIHYDCFESRLTANIHINCLLCPRVYSQLTPKSDFDSHYTGAQSAPRAIIAPPPHSIWISPLPRFGPYSCWTRPIHPRTQIRIH